jgi:hypothetical protein
MAGDRCFEIADTVPFRYSSTQALFKKMSTKKAGDQSIIKNL